MLFQAGSAIVVIPPEKTTDLGGYAGRTGKSPGTHDDLYAKALVREQKGNFYAVITADLAGLSQNKEENKTAAWYSGKASGLSLQPHSFRADP